MFLVIATKGRLLAKMADRVELPTSTESCIFFNELLQYFTVPPELEISMLRACKI